MRIVEEAKEFAVNTMSEIAEKLIAHYCPTTTDPLEVGQTDKVGHYEIYTETQGDGEPVCCLDIQATEGDYKSVNYKTVDAAFFAALCPQYYYHEITTADTGNLVCFSFNF